MKNTLKFLLMSGVALASVHSASAGGDQNLEDRIAALEAMVKDLKSELAAKSQKTDDDLVRIEKKAVEAAQTVSKSASDGMMVGDTKVKIGGYIDLDAHVTAMDGQFASSSIARDFYIPGAIPIGGDETLTTDFTTQATRFYISANRMAGDHKVAAHLEMDFLGSLQGDERVSNSFSPRLRRAYLDFDNWRIGQEWSTFQNTSAIPESASFLVASDGMIFMRQPMIRYTNGNWQFAAESGDATITPTTGSGRIEADSNVLPDLVGRYNFKGDFGNVSVAAIARQLRYEATGIDEETFAYGISVSGKLKAGEKDDVRFSLTAGEGVGRYIGLNAVNGAALNPVTLELEAIPSVGGLIAWRHPFGETARFNIGYSGLFVDQPDYVSSASTDSVQSLFGAILWDIAPKVTVGTELLFGQRETTAGIDGDMTRFTFSTKYAF